MDEQHGASDTGFTLEPPPPPPAQPTGEPVPPPPPSGQQPYTIPVAPPPPPSGQQPYAIPVASPTATPVTYAQSPQALGPPGIGVAGFVCVIVGLIIPFVGIVGLVLSWVGLSQAKREGRPQGLARAGVIVGIVAMILGIIILIAVIAGAAVGGGS